MSRSGYVDYDDCDEFGMWELYLALQERIRELDARELTANLSQT